MIGPTTFVVPLQNGVDAASELSALLGPDRVLVGLCGTLSWVTAPGCIRTVQGPNYIQFGEQDHRFSDRADRLLGAFKKTGISVEIPSDIHRALWEKFLVVTSFGGVGAVTRAPIGAMRARPETRQMLESCMEGLVRDLLRRGGFRPVDRSLRHLRHGEARPVRAAMSPEFVSTAPVDPGQTSPRLDSRANLVSAARSA